MLCMDNFNLLESSVVMKQDGHIFNSAVLSMISILYLFFFVIIYNFTKGHHFSLPRCVPLLAT